MSSRDHLQAKKMTSTSAIASNPRAASEATFGVFVVDVTCGRFGVLQYVSKPGHPYCPEAARWVHVRFGHEITCPSRQGGNAVWCP